MFEKLNGFKKKVSDLPDQPTLTPIELKAQFDAAPEELRVHLNQIIDDIQKSIADIKQQEDDINAVLLNGWVNGYGQQQARYYKDAVGRVHINGRIKNGSTAEGVTIFKLPSGYRPTDYIYTPIRGGNIFIDTNGDVKLYVVNNADIGIDNVSFRAKG